MDATNFQLDDLFSFLTGKASTAIGRRLQRNFNAAGLTITQEQWSVLMALWTKDGLSQQEICNEVFKDRPSVTRLIDNLEKYGYVQRTKVVGDRRTNTICLTEKGRGLKVITKEIAQNTLLESLVGVSEAEMLVCKSVLGKVFENLR